MLRDKLTSLLAGRIIDVIKETGKKSYISDESRINRKYYQRKHFRMLRFHILVRVLYNLSMWMDRDDFRELGASLFDRIWLYQDENGWDFNDEEF